MLTDDNLQHYQMSAMKTSEQMTQQRDQAKFAQDYGQLGPRQDQLQGLINCRYQVLHPGNSRPRTCAAAECDGKRLRPHRQGHERH
jgi:hypothetical protein